ncbi:CDGSH iron-sulfur domain-containing protein NEET [Euphorbia lathyris]|uniref:CDGSH iron-sulfur domain-containing protein NEET n=1 Tax=Euphorbia lathyris TaxID=212925 RepID=UPI003313118A
MAAISSPFVTGFCYSKSSFERLNPSSRLTAKPRRMLAIRAEAQAINPDIRKNEDKVVDSVPVNELSKPLTAYCRCWRSGTFPLCDGSHVKHNKATGDNVGPLLLKRPKE